MGITIPIILLADVLETNVILQITKTYFDKLIKIVILEGYFMQWKYLILLQEKHDKGLILGQWKISVVSAFRRHLKGRPPVDGALKLRNIYDRVEQILFA